MVQKNWNVMKKKTLLIISKTEVVRMSTDELLENINERIHELGFKYVPYLLIMERVKEEIEKFKESNKQ